MTENNNNARYAIVIIILLCIMYIYKQIIIVTTYQNDDIQPTPTDQASSVLIKRPASMAGLDPRTRILRLLPTKTDKLDGDSVSSSEQGRSRMREGRGEKRARSLTPHNRAVPGYEQVMHHATRDAAEHPSLGRFTGTKKKKKNYTATVTSSGNNYREEDVELRISSPIVFYEADKVAYHLG